MKKIILFIFIIISLIGCASTKYKALGNQSDTELARAKYECEYPAEAAHQARMSNDSNSNSYTPPPTYKTDVNCYRVGDSVNCSGNTYQDNSAQAAYSAGEGVGNLIGAIISSVKKRNQMKDCMEVHGFVEQ